MIQALLTAASGIRQGLDSLDGAARDVALDAASADGELPAPVAGVDDGLAASVVQAILAKHTVKINAAMFRRADAVAGELVDLVG